MMQFIDLLIRNLKHERELRVEVFLRYKTLYPNLSNLFLKHAQELIPLIGLSRRPGAALPKSPTEADIAEFTSGKRKFSFDEHVADYAYWFVNKSQRKQRELFFGHGGMSFLFMPADPNTKPPQPKISQAMKDWHPAFKRFDVEAAIATTAAIADSFREKSIQLFGNGLEDDPQTDGLPFIIPLLTAKDFMEANSEERQKWFQLFDVYLNESPQDGGVLLACGENLEEMLINILREMRDANFLYQI